MAAALRGLVIGGLIVTHSICTASTVSPPRLSPKVHLLPQINFQKKGTEIPIRVHVMHSPVLDVSDYCILLSGVTFDLGIEYIERLILKISDNSVRLSLNSIFPPQIVCSLAGAASCGFRRRSWFQKSLRNRLLSIESE